MSENDEAVPATTFILHEGVIKMQQMAILLILLIVVLTYEDIYYKLINFISTDVDEEEEKQ